MSGKVFDFSNIGNDYYSRIKFLIGKAAVYLLLLVYPLVLKNKLFGLTATRYNFFIFVSFACFGAMIVNEVFRFFSSGTVVFSVESLVAGIKKIPVYMWLILALGVSAVVAYLVSPYKTVALAGDGNRYVGMIFILALVCVYITISKCYIFNKVDIHLMMIVAAGVNLLAVAHFMGIDTFGFFTQVVASQKPLFITTFGNVDVYGVYALLTMIISMYAFMKCNDGKIRIFYAVSAFIASMGAIITGSDAVLLGIIVFFAVMLYVMVDSLDNLKRYFLALLVFFIAGRYLYVMTLFDLPDLRQIKGVISGLVYSNFPYLIMLLLIAVYYGVLRLVNNKFKFKQSVVAGIRKGLIILAGVVLLLVVVMFILVNVAGVNAPFGLNDYFMLNDDWGSGRGFIWSSLFEAYGNFPIVNKIFGLGEATVASALKDYTALQYNLLNGQLVDSAHNIPLQFFMTQGIIGFAAFVGLYVYLVIRIVKLAKRFKKRNYGDEANIFIGLGIAAAVCFVQGIFCILETIAFPITFCVLAMFNAAYKE